MLASFVAVLSVMMHFRGCSGKPNKKARAYHSGEVTDARFFLEQLNQQFPNNPKVAVGISLGGNMLANYLAEYKDDPILSAATIVSAPLDLAACANRIEQLLESLPTLLALLTQAQCVTEARFDPRRVSPVVQLDQTRHSLV